MSQKHDADYVGYKNPPLQTRFKPGTSGNPKGRPKGVRNFKTELREELGELIAVRDGDRERKISKQRAFIKALVGLALEGDLRAATILSSLCARVFGSEAEEEASVGVEPDDRHILEAFVARELKRHPDGALSVDDPAAALNDGASDANEEE
ncbi:MAG: DUF5681 domain-containing protein [Xanthobacteraceae bacterium]